MIRFFFFFVLWCVLASLILLLIWSIVEKHIIISSFNKELPIRSRGGDHSKFYSESAALLIHTAQVDKNYEDKEKDIIESTLLTLGAKESNIARLMLEAAVLDKNSSRLYVSSHERVFQIDPYIATVKNAYKTDKFEIIESMWKIIYSDDIVSLYEKNLLRIFMGKNYLDIDTKTLRSLEEKVIKLIGKK